MSRTWNEVILAISASLGAGGLIAAGLQTGAVFFWILLAIVVAGVSVDFIARFRRSIKSLPPLKIYIVTMKFDDSADTDVVEVKARGFEEAKHWAYLDKPPFERYRWNIVLVQEKMS